MLHIHQSSWPIGWEFLHGLKLYLKNKQTKQLNLLVCYKSLENERKWGQVTEQSKVLCPLNPEGCIITSRGKGKPCKLSLYPVIPPQTMPMQFDFDLVFPGLMTPYKNIFKKNPNSSLVWFKKKGG